MTPTKIRSFLFFFKKSKLEPVDRSTDQAIDWSAPLNCWRLSRALYDPSDDQGFSAQIERLRFNAHRSREQHARTLQKALGPQHLDRRLMVRHFFFQFFFFFFFFFLQTAIISDVPFGPRSGRNIRPTASNAGQSNRVEV